MTRPLTMLEAEARGLLAGAGVTLFDSEDAWDVWAEPNCYECPHFFAMDDPRACALRPAVLYCMVSPELAGIFGFGHATLEGSNDGVTWEDARDVWLPPERCHFKPWRDPDDDDPEEEWTPVPVPPPGGVKTVDDPAAIFEAMQRPPAEPFTVAG
jgi:hypothetical protein